MNNQLQTPPHSPENHPNMVSHPEVADRSRRAPSVSSRTPRTKHHRGRSHHGGASYQPQNEFPFFAQTGDVEIIISAEGQEKRYLLHRLILAQCSGFFNASTSEEWSRAQAIQQVQNSASRPEQALTRIGEDEDAAPSTAIISPETLSRGPPSRKRWRYELDWEHSDDQDDPILVQKVDFMVNSLNKALLTLCSRPQILAVYSLPILLPYNHRHVQSLRLHIPADSSAQCSVLNPQQICQ